MYIYIEHYRASRFELFKKWLTKLLFCLSGRLFDVLTEFKNMSPMSLHYWGENPRGAWNIALRNVKPNSSDSGMIFIREFVIFKEVVKKIQLIGKICEVFISSLLISIFVKIVIHI